MTCVYLHGCLPSYYLKQIAQEIAAGVAGRTPRRQPDRSLWTDRPGRDRAERPGQLDDLSRATASLVGRMVLPEHTTNERSQQQCWF